MLPDVFKMHYDQEREQFLNALAQGAPLSLALDFSGLSQSEFDHLVRHDPDFDREIKKIHAKATLELTSSIRLHALNPTASEYVGDWKAAAWLLERSPQSQPIFAPETKNDSNQTVNIRDLLRAALLEVDAHVIEHPPRGAEQETDNADKNKETVSVTRMDVEKEF